METHNSCATSCVSGAEEPTLNCTPQVAVASHTTKLLFQTAVCYHVQEEALIAQDNKAHVAAWQAQLADMKARQAAAVAAARAASGTLPGNSSGISPAAAGAAVNADGALQHGSSFHHSGSGAAGGGLGGRKRSMTDMQRQASARSSKLPRLGPNNNTGLGGDMDEDGALLMASLSRADRAAASGRGGSGQLGSGRLPSGKLGSPAGMKRETSSLAIAAAAAAEAGAAGKKKKKPSARHVAAQLLGVAARASAAAGPQQATCYLVHLLPANRQPGGSGAAGAAVPASREGRGRKQPSQQAQLAALRLQQQWQEDGQRYSAPDVDQPYLTCPMGLTVSCLKELLLQQLRQQGATEWGGQQPGDVQLLLMQPAGLDTDAAAAKTAAAGVLGDGLTVAQLYERWWGVGPEVQVLYRLLIS
jgi:hypothetical protein